MARIEFKGSIFSTEEPQQIHKKDGTTATLNKIVVNTEQGEENQSLVQIEYWQGNQWTAPLEQAKIGDSMIFKCDLSSRQYNGKWYHNVRCYNARYENAQPVQQTQQAQQQQSYVQPVSQPQQQPTQQEPVKDDDLPF